MLEPRMMLVPGKVPEPKKMLEPGGDAGVQEGAHPCSFKVHNILTGSSWGPNCLAVRLRAKLSVFN